jgi:drug/metabolite transporter (DMT)-like permease
VGAPLARLWDRPLALLWVAPLIWSTNITLGRAVAASFPPVSLTLLRWLVAGAVLAPVVRRRAGAQMPLLRRHWFLMLASGGLGMAGYSALAYLALRTTTAANVAFINSTVPLMVPLVMLVIAREPMHPRTLAGIGVSFCGVAWIIARGDPASLSHLSFAGGEVITLAAVAMYAVYSVLIRKKPRELDLLVFLFGCMIGAIVVLLPFFALELAGGARIPTDPRSLAILLYIGVVISLFAFLLWNHCVITLGPGITGASYHLISVFTPLAAYLWLGERLAGYHYAGIALILVGVFIATRRVA